jgi:hypothetical protein
LLPTVGPGADMATRNAPISLDRDP